jgi:hypothetical protein
MSPQRGVSHLLTATTRRCLISLIETPATIGLRSIRSIQSSRGRLRTKTETDVAAPKIVVLRAAGSLLSHAPCYRAAAELCLGAAECADPTLLSEYRSKICDLIRVQPPGRPLEDAEDLVGAARHALHTSGGGSLSHRQIAARAGISTDVVRKSIRRYRLRKGS